MSDEARAERGLADLALRRGDPVRFRRRAGGHWQEGVVVGLEADGSLGIRDRDGASRALRPELVEVKTSGPRSASRWEPVLERAARTEQLKLL